MVRDMYISPLEGHIHARKFANQGRRNVLQSGGAQWRNEPKYFGGRTIFARERSDRGAGASIHFSDGGGGQNLQYNTLRA